MKRIGLGLLALVVLGTASRIIPVAKPAAMAAVPGQAAGSEEEELMRHVQVLAADSMEGRMIGSAGSARARAYIVRIFHEAGMERVGAAYEQPFETRKSPAPGKPPVTYRGANVIGLVRGRVYPQHYIVLTAHYDHLGIEKGQIYNGADDNASGVAALPVLAVWFKQHPPEHSLLFVALDGEEQGYLGAEAFLASPPVEAEAMVLNINLDMIGRNAQGELFAAGTRHYPQLRAPLDSVARTAPVRLRFGHEQKNLLRPADDWTNASDHAVFHARHIPFVYFGEEDHPDYHQPTDDAERLMPSFYAGAFATVRAAISALDRALGLRG